MRTSRSNPTSRSRLLTQIGVLAAVSLLVTACLSGADDTRADQDETTQDAEGATDTTDDAADNADADGDVTIEFWTAPFWIGWGDEKVPALVDEFNETHDGITVEFTRLEWQDGREQIKQAVGAGTGPDVFFMDNGLDIDYLESGSLASLEDVGYTQEHIDAYAPEIAVNEYEGELYGAPLNFGAMVLVYNPEILAEYGYDEPPATWDELKETAATITEGSDEEIWGWQFKGMDDHLNAIHSTWQTFLWQAGGDYMSEDMTHSVQHSDAGETAMEFMKSFYTEGISPVGTSAEDSFISGNVAMYFWDNTVDLTDAENYTMAPLPEGPDNGQSYVKGHSLVANADSEHLEAAGEFMRWLASPERSAQYMEFRGIFPYELDAVSDEVREDVEATIEADDNWPAIFEQFERSDPTILQQDRYAYTARWNAQAAHIVAGIGGQTPVPDALEAVDAEINEALGAD